MPALGRRYFLFVDTEEEFDWDAPFRRESNQTTAIAALPEAQRRFRAAGAIPCYLVNYPVVANAASAAIMSALVQEQGAVIGTHLHPWVNPPHVEPVNRYNSFVGNLGAQAEGDKLRVVTEEIARVCGERPVIYRAGRYGIGPDTARLLLAEGYRLDVSVRSRFDYRAEGGPDFTGYPLWPWWIDRDRGLLELPLSTAFVGGLRGLGESGYRWLGRIPRAHGVFARTHLLERIALTPEGVPVADALRAIDALIDDGIGFFSLSFHSPSLVPGHTPYVRDADDLAMFWRWWDAVFNRFARAGIEGGDPRALIAAADAAR